MLGMDDDTYQRLFQLSLVGQNLYRGQRNLSYRPNATSRLFLTPQIQQAADKCVYIYQLGLPPLHMREGHKMLYKVRAAFGFRKDFSQLGGDVGSGTLQQLL